MNAEEESSGALPSTLTEPGRAESNGTASSSTASVGALSNSTPASYGALYRRIARRETHSPRSLLAIVIAVIAMLACAYVAVEALLQLLAQPPLGTRLVNVATFATDAGTYPPGTVTTAGIVAALVGLMLVIAAITPGRRARHLIETQRTVTVVDNAVIASALARHAAHAGGVDADNARVSVSHRNAVVRLTPASGIPTDREAVEKAVRDQLASYGLRPRARARVIVENAGKVGS